jgi:hypothetical protein
METQQNVNPTDEPTQFLEGLFRGLDDTKELAYCIFFPGDPGAFKKWGGGFGWHGRRIMPHTEQNGYVCISAMGEDEQFHVSRRTSNFTGGFALMVDDVGTKVDPVVVRTVQPSATVLTSPGNRQYWYFLDEPLRDKQLFKDLIDGFIRDKCGVDPGMAGVNRLARIPGYLNMKPAYGGKFQVTLEQMDADRRYSTHDLIRGFGLKPLAVRQETSLYLTQEEIAERVERYRTVYRWLRMNGMVTKERGRQTDVTCPWVKDHTNEINSGTALIIPEVANGWNGGFRCHHGHCHDKKISDVTDWIVERITGEKE